jgi:hypothetical protein
MTEGVRGALRPAAMNALCKRSPERRVVSPRGCARQLRRVPVLANIAAVEDRGIPMSGKVDLAKSKATKSKLYVKPTLVKGPVLASITAIAKNISGVQKQP